MAGEIRITKKDWMTISLALSYAREERESFLDAIRSSEEEGSEVWAHTNDLISRFEKLHKKLFDQPTAYQRDLEANRNAPQISIFDIKMKNDGEG